MIHIKADTVGIDKPKQNKVLNAIQLGFFAAGISILAEKSALQQSKKLLQQCTKLLRKATEAFRTPKDREMFSNDNELAAGVRVE